MTDPDKKYRYLKRNFQQTAWLEPLIQEQLRPGERGILPPPTEAGIDEAVGSDAGLPDGLRRQQPPQLPEMAQPHVLRHYSRLSQMALGNNVANSIGLATATMKYSPPVHEYLVRLPQLADVHPEQDVGSMQGVLEVIYRCGELLKAISGMDAFSMQPGGGAAAIFCNALVVKRYYEENGQADKRIEVITTLNSHPANAAASAAAGFKVIHLPPGPRGYPDTEALRAAVSGNTAALFTTNPEDVGVYNPHIAEWVEIVHDAGGLCVYDQANANGVVGITRARDAGFDLCHFNLHKTFSVPHGSYGGGCGALGVRADLKKYLPQPMVEFDGERYTLGKDSGHSIGKVRSFLGNVQAVVKAYAWIMSHGAEGLREVAEIAVLNNNYLARRLMDIKGASLSYYPANSDHRIEQVRMSWQKLADETGIDTEEIRNRIVDFGLQTYWPSHHPYTIEQPFSVEPTESVSREDLDELYEAFSFIAEEAYTDPEKIRTAPHNSTTVRLAADAFDDPPITWRALRRRREALGQ